jgi:hypothetical protein
MTQHRIRLCLHLLLAKSVQAYLDENSGDASAALTAAQRDVTQREGQNSSARAFQRAYTKLVETLKLSTSPEDAEAASDAALAAVRAMSEAGATATQVTAALKKLDLDPAKLAEQVTELRTQAANGAKAAELERSIAFRDAADGLGYDAGRLAKILRDETGLPEKRTLKTTVDGKETETETWGIPSRDAAGKETGFTALDQHPEVRGFEAALKKTPTQAPAAPTFNQPSLPTQRSGTAPPAGGQPLDPGAIRAEILSNGAGSI